MHEELLGPFYKGAGDHLALTDVARPAHFENIHWIVFLVKQTDLLLVNRVYSCLISRLDKLTRLSFIFDFIQL